MHNYIPSGIQQRAEVMRQPSKHYHEESSNYHIKYPEISTIKSPLAWNSCLYSIIILRKSEALVPFCPQPHNTTQLPSYFSAHFMWKIFKRHIWTPVTKPVRKTSLSVVDGLLRWKKTKKSENYGCFRTLEKENIKIFEQNFLIN